MKTSSSIITFANLTSECMTTLLILPVQTLEQPSVALTYCYTCHQISILRQKNNNTISTVLRFLFNTLITVKILLSFLEYNTAFMHS